MTFEEYAQKHLGSAGLSYTAMEMVRMGWNARGNHCSFPEKPDNSDHIADDRKMVKGDVSTAGSVILLEGKTYERAIVVAFESDDDLRAAIAAGQCRFTVFGGEV